jgi:predicted nucleotidyltransferase component of viral defense system
MIHRANINAWRKVAPWPESAQVEQDLILSRALVEMFRRTEVAEQAVFCGGTALHKLFIQPPGRYSEDIDLVQRDTGPIGSLVNAIRDVLDPWLGKPNWKQGKGRFTLYYRFDTTFEPVQRMRVKVEINTREHFAVQALRKKEFVVENGWFEGSAKVTTYGISELLGTKLRALYQRKKGRDLFDLWLGFTNPDVVIEDLLTSFDAYMKFVGATTTRAQYEANMVAKMQDNAFLGDLRQLVRYDLDYDVKEAWRTVHKQIVSRLPGEPWKGLSSE